MDILECDVQVGFPRVCGGNPDRHGKLAIKRHLDIDLLDDILVLTLARTGTHSDIFGK